MPLNFSAPDIEILLQAIDRLHVSPLFPLADADFTRLANIRQSLKDKYEFFKNHTCKTYTWNCPMCNMENGNK